MATKTIESYIADGEKYALIGLDVKVEGEFEDCRVTPKLWVFNDTAFTLPTHWRKWLGTIRSEEMSAVIFLCSANLSPFGRRFLTPKMMN